jgi:hypothetical protein
VPCKQGRRRRPGWANKLHTLNCAEAGHLRASRLWKAATIHCADPAFCAKSGQEPGVSAVGLDMLADVTGSAVLI